MTGLAIVLIAGLAGFWLWTVLNDDDGIFRRFKEWAVQYHYGKKWITCPWCSGAWLAGIASLALYEVADTSIVRAIVIALAAAAITGMLGSYFGED